MRVLLDENLPIDLARELSGHDVQTVVGLGWEGVTNGELLRRAAGRFDALITMDRNLALSVSRRSGSWSSGRRRTGCCT